MTHPQELLADYVDGTLTHDERADVDTHLASCATCTEEIDLARHATAALASLEDRPVPFGVVGPVLAEAGRRHERRRAIWERFQWVAGAAAAAALVVVVAINLPRGGGDESTAGAGGGAAATGAGRESAALQAEVGLERQPDVRYDDAGVRSLAEDAAADLAEGGGDQRGQAGEALAPAGGALRCLEQAEVPLRDKATRLVRLIEARYQRTPAYFAVLLQGPGAGQPPESAVVYVVSVQGCSFLSAADLRF